VERGRLLGLLGADLRGARLLGECRGRDREDDCRRRGAHDQGTPRLPRDDPARLTEGDGDADPANRQRHVHHRELRDRQVQQAGAEGDNARGEHVAAAHEEGVNRLLGFVFLFARGVQPQQLARRVHHRVVGRVLRGLDPADHREADAGGDNRVTAERDERQYEQHAAQAAILDQPRGDQRLDQQGGDVDPELVVAAEGTDVRLLVERGARERELLHVQRQQARHEVFPRAVDDVEQHDERGNQPQIPVGEYQAEAAGSRQRRRRGATPLFVALADAQIDEDARREEQRRDVEDDLWRDARVKQTTRDQRAKGRAGGHPDHDDREQAVAGLLAVDVVGEGPELRHERHVEDSDPDEEGDAHVRHVRGDGRREQLDGDDEKERDADQQLRAVHARGEPAVKGNGRHQEEGLSRRGVRPNLRAAAQQNQRFAHGLDDGVADQEQEDVRQHQERRRAFAGPHLGKERERTVQRGLPGSVCGGEYGCGHSGPPVCLAPNASTAVEPRNSWFCPAVGKAFQGDRLARTQQVRHDVVVDGREALWPPVDEEWPESLANGGREHAFEVFERGSSKLLVVAVEAPEGYLQRFSRQDER